MADANPNPDEFELTSDPAPKKPEETSTDAQGGASRPSIIPPEIANKIPPAMRETLEFSMMAMGPMANPMTQHVTAEHITKVIDHQEAASVRKDRRDREELKDKKHVRLTNCVAGIVLLIVTGALWGFLPKDRLDSFKEIAKSAILIIGGGAGGYGLALKKQSDEKKD